MLFYKSQFELMVCLITPLATMILLSLHLILAFA